MTTPINQLSKLTAQDIFVYDDSQGTLYWKVKPSKKISVGARAGCLDKSRGYRKIRFANKDFKEHNVIWNLHFGNIPSGMEVDHIDRNKTNNRISNLRLANRVQQSINILARGFTWSKKDKVWRAQYERLGKKVYIGSFKTALQARLAYERELSKTEPEFANMFFTESIASSIT